MNDDILNELDNIAEEFLDSNLVKEYKELNKLVELKYSHEILMFSTAKEKLEEMKKYAKDLSKYNKALSEAKEVLYSKLEVKRIKELERILDSKLNDITNDLAKHLSNTYKKKRGI